MDERTEEPIAPTGAPGVPPADKGPAGEGARGSPPPRLVPSRRDGPDRDASQRDATNLDEAKLQRFMDARLDGDEQQAVQAQLARSPEARRSLDALREEARLLREAVENLSEPPAKMGEKVLAVLFAEQRQRVALQRARRLRNRLVATAAAAAAILLAVYTLGPQDEASHLVSGTGASVSRHGAAPVALGKDGRLYVNDAVVLGAAQFVRLALSDGSVTDVDEESRLQFAKGGPAPVVSLEVGRARFQVASGSRGLLVQTPFGQVRGEAGAAFEVWLPLPVQARWPDWAGPWAAPAAAAAPSGPARPWAAPAANAAPSSPARLTSLTVYEGPVYIHDAAQPQGLLVPPSHRALFGENIPATAGVAFKDWQALDSRREPWHGLEGAEPAGFALLGLFPPFDWLDLGDRLRLTGNVPGGAAVAKPLEEALQRLARAESGADPAVRAEGLGQAQQDLRVATLALPATSELRWHGRVVEGLAQYERGRALLAVGTPKALADAESAFWAAAVALDEALNGAGKDVDAAPGLAKRPAPGLALDSHLRDLMPADQALLFAWFYEPCALYQFKALAAPAHPAPAEAPHLEAADPRTLFASAGAVLDHSVEALAARYGEALAWAQAGRVADALAVLEELAGTSAAGLQGDVRAGIEGLRQAAHLEAARLYARTGQTKKLRTMVEAFRLRYPLEPDGPAGRALEQLLQKAPDAQGLTPPAKPAP